METAEVFPASRVQVKPLTQIELEQLRKEFEAMALLLMTDPLKSLM